MPMGLGWGDGEGDNGGPSSDGLTSGVSCGTGEIVSTNAHSGLGSRLAGVATGEGSWAKGASDSVNEARCALDLRPRNNLVPYEA